MAEKKQNKQGGGEGGGRTYLFENPTGSFHFFTLNLEIPQNCVRSLGNSNTKNQDP